MDSAMAIIGNQVEMNEYCLFIIGEIQYSLEQLNIEIKEVLVNTNPHSSLNISSKAISRLGWVVPLFGGTVAQIHYWVATVDISTIRWHTVVLGGRGGGQTNVTRVGGDYDGLAAKEGGAFEIDRLPKLPSHSLIAPSLGFIPFSLLCTSC